MGAQSPRTHDADRSDEFVASASRLGVAGRQDVQRVPVRSLRPGDSPRLSGEDDEHTRMLAESEAALPPILVHRTTMRVIDGAHRLRAALLRRDEMIEVRFFDGTDTDAFVAAVRANVAHGLPLTLADRRAAAVRILAAYPQRSDRSIAELTGLAAATVGEIRRRNEPERRQVSARIGRDGRVRPLNTADARRLVSDTLTERPDASLREVARVAGVSPTTVQDVRDRMRRGEDPVPPGLAAPARKAAGEPDHRPRAGGVGRDRESLLRALSEDPSMRFPEPGRKLLRLLLDRAGGLGGCRELMDLISPHCHYSVAALARACAQEWLDFADELEYQLRAQA